MEASGRPSQPFGEDLPADGERIRAQSPEDAFDLSPVVCQPHPAQLAHVPVAELAALDELEDQPVVAMPRRPVVGPHELAGHAEMEEEGRAVGPADEPLAVASRFLDPAPPEGAAHRVRGGVPKDGRIGPHVRVIGKAQTIQGDPRD